MNINTICGKKPRYSINPNANIDLVFLKYKFKFPELSGLMEELNSFTDKETILYRIINCPETDLIIELSTLLVDLTRSQRIESEYIFNNDIGEVELV